MNRDQQNESDADHQMPSWREVFLYFLFLGFVNVGLRRRYYRASGADAYTMRRDPP